MQWHMENGPINENFDYGLHIKDCYNTGKISGKQYIGGLIGDIEFDDYYGNQYIYPGAIIENCYNSGEVEGTDSVGGLIGEYINSIILRNSYNIGEVKGNTAVGGIVAYTANWYNDSVNIIKNCYYYKEDSGINSNIEFIGKIKEDCKETGKYEYTDNGVKNTISQLNSKDFIKNTLKWDVYENGSGVWKIDENGNPKLSYQQ